MKLKNIVFMVIAVILAVLLFNPAWLPLSSDTESSMKEMIRKNFLLEGDAHITLAHILTLILAICVVWIIYTVIKALLKLSASRSDHNATVATLLTELIRYLAVIIAFIWGLHILGVNTAAVLAGAGIIGLIIGFGAQSLIEDIITGIFIIFEKQYQIGDIIILDDFRGTVRSIGVRTTTIEDAGGNLKIVNNSDATSRTAPQISPSPSVTCLWPMALISGDLRKLSAKHFPKCWKVTKIYISPRPDISASKSLRTAVST